MAGAGKGPEVRKGINWKKYYDNMLEINKPNEEFVSRSVKKIIKKNGKMTFIY